LPARHPWNQRAKNKHINNHKNHPNHINHSSDILSQFRQLPRKKHLIAFISITTLLLLLFLWRGGHWLVHEKPLQPADAIVMLLGSTPERELEVADIYHQDFAPIIIMAEFRVHNHELIEAHGLNAPRSIDNSLCILHQLGIPPEAIHITPGDISSTRGEAEQSEIPIP